LDKTPAYALILPFMERVFPDAKYVVLTRHPAALFASYANSFFNGDYCAAHQYNPILERYVPAIARFLRDTSVAHIHVRYEDLVTEPETWMKRICETIGVPFEPEIIRYGGKKKDQEPRQGLGDPLGVDRHDRPVTDSVEKWVAELSGDTEKREFLVKMISRLAPEDLTTWGYPPEKLWEPLERAAGKRVKSASGQKRFYQLQRWLIVRLRAFARRNSVFRRLLHTVRLACDVVLRE